VVGRSAVLAYSLFTSRSGTSAVKNPTRTCGSTSARYGHRRSAAGFHWLLAQHAELVALFFAAGRANPAVRAALQGFVAEGRQLLADYLATRVTAGELREHDTRATAQCCCQPWRWARSPGRPWTPPPWSTCYCAA
jgi:hypothetical protein